MKILKKNSYFTSRLCLGKLKSKKKNWNSKKFTTANMLNKLLEENGMQPKLKKRILMVIFFNGSNCRSFVFLFAHFVLLV